MSSKSWKTFLKFLTHSKVFLLLRIVNLNLQIIINDRSEIDKEEECEEERQQEVKLEKIIKAENIEVETENIMDCIFDDSTVKEELITGDFVDNDAFETKPENSSSTCLLDQSNKSETMKKKTSINLEYLNECIAKVIIY